MQKSIVSFFNEVLQRTPSSLQLIAASKAMYIDPKSGSLIFTLPGLYQLFEKEKNCSYKQFRKELYQSDLNLELSKQGGRIELFSSTGKVETSEYQLVSLNKEKTNHSSVLPSLE